MQKTSERVLYVWGQARDRAKYNRQLGTGLAKHAGSRMYKPFLHHRVGLEAPYYSRSTLTRLAAIDGATLKELGGKPGLFLRLFGKELNELGVPESLVMNSRKIRFQDGSDGGRGGITPVLQGAGFGQDRLIRLFNDYFAADIDYQMDGAQPKSGRPL